MQDKVGLLSDCSIRDVFFLMTNLNPSGQVDLEDTLYLGTFLDKGKITRSLRIL